MFWNLKEKRERDSRYAELYCQARFAKIVTVHGAQVLFNLSPHTDPKKTLLSISTYIAGTGTVIFNQTLDGNIESGIEKKIDYKFLAKEAIKDSRNIIDIKYSPQMIQIVSELLIAGKQFDFIERYTNGLLRRALTVRGILVQPCTGYDATDMIMSMSKDTLDKVKTALNIQTPPPPPPPEAQPASNPKSKLH